MAINPGPGLQDKVLDFNVSKGLNEADDSLSAEPDPLQPFLADATDCLFTKDGRVERRPGTTAVTATGLTGLPLALIPYGDALFSQTSTGVHSYAEKKATPFTLLGQGAGLGYSVKVDTAVRQNDSTYFADIAVGGGVRCYTWSTGGTVASVNAGTSYVYAQVVDDTTGDVILPPTIISSNPAYYPKVVALTTGFLCVFQQGGGGGTDGQWHAVPITTAGVVGTEYSFQNETLASAQHHDLCVKHSTGLQAEAVWVQTNGTNMRVARLSSTAMTDSYLTGTMPVIADAMAATYISATGKIWIATWGNFTANTPSIYLHYTDYATLAAPTMAVSITTVAGMPSDFDTFSVDTRRVTISAQDVATGSLFVAWSWRVHRDYEGTPVAVPTDTDVCMRTYCMETAEFTSAGITPTNKSLSKGCVLSVKAKASSYLSRPHFGFTWAGDTTTLPSESGPISAKLATDDGGHQPTTILAFAQGGVVCPVARVFTDKTAWYESIASSVISARSLPNICDGTVLYSFRTAHSVITGVSASFAITDRGIDTATFNILPPGPRWIDSQGAMHSHGGMHLTLSPSVVSEGSPHFTPERPFVASIDDGVQTEGLLGPTHPVYTHQICAYYYWVDNLGLEHRSALSAIGSYTSRESLDANDDGEIFRPKVWMMPPPPSAMTGYPTASQIRVRIYGKLDTEVDFLMVYEGPITTATTAGWSYVSVDSTAYWGRSGLTYTSGGVLPSDPAPALTDICSWQDVLVGVDAGDRSLLWYTKPAEFGVSPEWNTSLTIRIPSEGGDVVSIYALDEKLVCLKERAIYYVVGSTRDRLGQGTDPVAVRVASDVGCAGRHTTALVPDGLLFIDNRGRGLCLLDRGLSLHKMRAAEDRFLTALPYIHSTLVVPHQSCVRWACYDGTAVNLDYLHGAFTRFTSYSGSLAQCVSIGHVMTINTNLAMSREGITGETPTAQSPYWTITTNWIKLAGLSGFQRVKRAMLVCTPPNSSKYGAVGLQGTYWLNYDDVTPISSVYWDPVAWDTDRHQVEWHLPRQKCTSIRFKIQERAITAPPQSSPDFRGITLSMMSLRLGVKPSHSKNLNASGRSPTHGSGA